MPSPSESSEVTRMLSRIGPPAPAVVDVNLMIVLSPVAIKDTEPCWSSMSSGATEKDCVSRTMLESTSTTSTSNVRGPVSPNMFPPKSKDSVKFCPSLVGTV